MKTGKLLSVILSVVLIFYSFPFVLISAQETSNKTVSYTDNNITSITNGDVLLEKPPIQYVIKNNVTLTYYEGYEYSCDGINWQQSNFFENLSYDTLYEFSRRLIDNDKSEPIFMTGFIIAGKPEISLICSTKVVIKTEHNCEYSLDGITWNTNATFEDLTPNFNYTLYKRYNYENTLCITNEGTEFTTNASDNVNTNPQATDLITLIKGLLNQEKNTSFDYNDDGVINILDFIRLKKYLSGENVTLGKQFLSPNGIIHLSRQTLNIGNTLTVNIMLDAGEPIYAISCVVKYDNSILEYKSGSAYGSNGALEIIESPSGETKVLYSLTFTAIAAGSGTISISDCSYSTLGANGAVDKYFKNSYDSIDVLVS